MSVWEDLIVKARLRNRRVERGLDDESSVRRHGTTGHHLPNLHSSSLENWDAKKSGGKASKLSFGIGPSFIISVPSTFICRYLFQAMFKSRHKKNFKQMQWKWCRGVVFHGDCQRTLTHFGNFTKSSEAGWEIGEQWRGRRDGVQEK